jgi:hypothetical protein
MQAPRAAGVAGVLFAILFTISLALLRTQPLLTADDSAIAGLFASGDESLAEFGGLYLAPFAGIMFLWFIAVIRDQIGAREDQFFATVFLGSGLIFVALLFAATAVADSLFVGSRYLGLAPPTASDVNLIRSLAYTLLFVFATRAAAVFLVSTATISLRSGVFPRGLALVGLVLGAALMFGVAFWDWVILVMPAWVAVMSLVVLGRARRRRLGGAVPVST